jgi:hypothetical protein
MINLFKVSIKFNSVLKNRGGRFLTVYSKGSRVNGKVLTTNPIFAKVQRAQDQKVVYVKNWKVNFVCADHLIHTEKGAF